MPEDSAAAAASALPGGGEREGRRAAWPGTKGTPCSQRLLGGDPSKGSACGPQWPKSSDAGWGGEAGGEWGRLWARP